MGEEHHHHLEFENAYVRVYFVEIPARESTLFHHHDFPYLSATPTGADAAMPPADGSAGSSTVVPRMSYSPGNFSHAVTNLRDYPLRNVAIELLRPQGAARNRCAEVIPDQPHEQCDFPDPRGPVGAASVPVFESDEILVRAWHMAADSVFPLPDADAHADMLIASLSGVFVTASGGITSAHALKGGLLWVPAGSKPTFRVGPKGDGYFFTIAFKDSKPPEP